MSDTAAVLSIGDELIGGDAIDTNAAWISARLHDLGLRVVERRTVPDDIEAIREALVALAARAGVVVSTGGLGPTKDDLTREGLALAMGEVMVEDAGAAESVRMIFAARGAELTVLNLVQAQRPVSAETLENKNGTAPGIAGQIGETAVYVLPGPPREMRPIFEESVAPRLGTGREAWVSRAIHTFGLGESDVARRLGNVLARTDGPLVGTTASNGVVTVRLRAPGSQRAELTAIGARVCEMLGGVIFGENGQTLAGCVVDLLREKNETVAVAESCTGGLLGSMVTSVAGSSDVFLGGWLTYSNVFKESKLGVDSGLIERHGAVSREVAVAMAEGALVRSGAKWALSITGVAGPGGGSDEKPVGTVWIGCARAGGEARARVFGFSGDRETVRQRAAMAALGALRLALDGRDNEALLWQRDG